MAIKNKFHIDHSSTYNQITVLSINEITLLSRSMREILLKLSTNIDVPEFQVTEGSTLSFPLAVNEHRLLNIHSQPEPPAEPFVSAACRNHGYSIENTDRQSKRVLTFLMVLISLAETGHLLKCP